MAIDKSETTRHWVIVEFSDIESVNQPDKRIAKDIIGVSWTTKLLLDNSAKERWVLCDHFSTLPDGSIPESGATFVESLIIHLKKKWLGVCDEAEIDLQQRVSSPISLLLVCRSCQHMYRLQNQ
jgi:hypothetical protein